MPVDAPIRLFDCLDSGNAYKVRLLLSQLGIEFERVEVDVFTQQTQSDAYRALNANARIPLLEWADGRRLAESNAILFYLADGTDYLPNDAWMRAQVLQWQNFEQYSHEPNIAVLRFWHHAGTLDANRRQIETKMAAGARALQVMEDHLSAQEFFVGGMYSIADISLYAYTHVAEEGGFHLEPYPAVRAWLGRVAAQPGHVPIMAEVGRALAWSDYLARTSG